MITRGDERSGAVFSDCERYRYRLWRRFDRPSLGKHSGAGICMFMLLNPSTADENVLDPTLARCWRFANRWGYAGMEVCNIFAYRATDPRDMRKQNDPIGPDNDDAIIEACCNSARVIVGWGNNGMRMGRAASVLRMLDQAEISVYSLRTTKAGAPSHPLYLPMDLTPQLYQGQVE